MIWYSWFTGKQTIVYAENFAKKNKNGLYGLESSLFVPPFYAVETIFNLRHKVQRAKTRS